MLLKELAVSSDTKIKKINEILKETFGFTLVSEISTGKLNTLYTKISDDLYDLKLDLGTVKNAKYMQKVLVLEGLKLLIKRNKKIHEALMVGPGAHAYERVNKWLSEFVYKACEVGDDYEEAIRDAMKQYRSSKYRFEDPVVEHDLRKSTQECAGVGDMAFVESITEDEDCDVCDKCDCNPCECEKEIDEAYTSKINRAARKYVPGYGKKQAAERKKDYAFLPGIMDPESDLYDEEDKAEAARDKRQARRYSRIAKGRKPFEEDGHPLDAQNFGTADEWTKEYAARDEGTYFGGDCKTCVGSGANNGVECDDCNGTGEIQNFEEGSADRHAEQDWIKGIKQEKGIDTEPGYDDPGSTGLSLSDPEDYGKTNTSDEPDDYFSYQRRKTMRENMKKGYIKNLRKLLEAEVEQAESLIAAKSFSQELQDMVEKLGRLVNENLPAVSEQMRDAYGSDVATGFEDQVAGTLNNVMDSLRNSKQEIDNSVSTIADGGMPSNDMADYGDEELGDEMGDLDLDSDVELGLDGDELEIGDEFGGDDAMAGMEDEPLGRAKKESIKILGKKILETQAKLARIKARL